MGASKVFSVKPERAHRRIKSVKGAKATLDPKEWDFRKQVLNDGEVDACLAYEYSREAIKQPYVVELIERRNKAERECRIGIALELRRVLRQFPFAGAFADQSEEVKPWRSLNPKERQVYVSSVRLPPSPGWSAFRAIVIETYLATNDLFDAFVLREQVFANSCGKATAPVAAGFFAIDPTKDETMIVSDFKRWLKDSKVVRKQGPRKRAGIKQARKLLMALGALRFKNAYAGKEILFWSKADALKGAPGANEEAGFPYSHAGDLSKAARLAVGHLHQNLGRDDDRERAQERKIAESLREFIRQRGPDFLGEAFRR